MASKNKFVYVPSQCKLQKKSVSITWTSGMLDTVFDGADQKIHMDILSREEEALCCAKIFLQALHEK